MNENFEPDDFDAGVLCETLSGLDGLLNELIFGSNKDEVSLGEKNLKRRVEEGNQKYLPMSLSPTTSIVDRSPHFRISSRVLTWILHRNHVFFTVNHLDPFIYFFEDDRWKTQSYACNREEDRSGLGQFARASTHDLDWSSHNEQESKTLRMATVSHLRALVRYKLKHSDVLQEISESSIMADLEKSIRSDREGDEKEIYITNFYILFNSQEKAYLK
eukprot:747074-Hanusia_phi.AAC.1